MAQIPIKIYGSGSRKGPANYKLIYYLGNEFANPTEEEQRYAIATGGWVGGRGINSSGTYYVGGFYTTAQAIDLSNYDYIFTRRGSMTYGGAGYWSVGYSPIYQFPSSFVQSVFNNTFASSIDTTDNTIWTILALSSKPNVSWGVGYRGGNGVNISKGNDSLVVDGQNSIGHITNYTWAVGVCNEDDITPLSAYGSDIATILSNSAQVFQDKNALKYIANKCTGNFMINALNNSTFLTQLNNSTNLNTEIIKADVDWAMMIELLDKHW